MNCKRYILCFPKRLKSHFEIKKSFCHYRAIVTVIIVFDFNFKRYIWHIESHLLHEIICFKRLLFNRGKRVT
jgi:hypothetical protein